MIEINLIPDVKLELLRVRRNRTMVVSASILVSLVSAGIVVLLALYVFAGQALAGRSLDGTIEKQSKELSAVQDLSEMLTIQSQLEQLSATHDNKNVTSRLFDLLSATIPEGKNKIAVSSIDLNIQDNVITIEGQANNGYEALEVYKKTLAATKFSYTVSDEKQEPVFIASDIQDLDRSFGDGKNGQSVLRFSLSFTYVPELFAPTSEKGSIIAPNKQNATDSAKGVPKSIFTDAADTTEENE